MEPGARPERLTKAPRAERKILLSGIPGESEDLLFDPANRVSHQGLQAAQATHASRLLLVAAKAKIGASCPVALLPGNDRFIVLRALVSTALSPPSQERELTDDCLSESSCAEWSETNRSYWVSLRWSEDLAAWWALQRTRRRALIDLTWGKK